MWRTKISASSVKSKFLPITCAFILVLAACGREDLSTQPAPVPTPTTTETAPSTPEFSGIAPIPTPEPTETPPSTATTTETAPSTPEFSGIAPIPTPEPTETAPSTPEFSGIAPIPTPEPTETPPSTPVATEPISGTGWYLNEDGQPVVTRILDKPESGLAYVSPGTGQQEIDFVTNCMIYRPSWLQSASYSTLYSECLEILTLSWVTILYEDRDKTCVYEALFNREIRLSYPDDYRHTMFDCPTGLNGADPNPLRPFLERCIELIERLEATGYKSATLAEVYDLRRPYRTTYAPDDIDLSNPIPDDGSYTGADRYGERASIPYFDRGICEAHNSGDALCYGSFIYDEEQDRNYRVGAPFIMGSNCSGNLLGSEPPVRDPANPCSVQRNVSQFLHAIMIGFGLAEYPYWTAISDNLFDDGHGYTAGTSLAYNWYHC